MSKNTVIVALPEQDDRVNKLSSEEKPHLTMLFLGETDKISDLQGIIQFVEHAVNVSEHGPFMLDIERRGELGEDKADVLFFRKGWSSKWIQQFRAQLLQNGSIQAAYQSTEQYPEWLPHLTMGYPEAPAKEDDRDHGLGWVSFDRIAVWTGDFDGPEFRLSWPENFDEIDSVGWSDFAEAKYIARNESLAHFGVKGMKWGVRGRDRNYERTQKLRAKAHAQDEKSVTVNPLHRNFLQKRATTNRIESNRLDRELTVAVATKARKSSAKEMRDLRKRPEFQNINYRDEKGHPKFDAEKYKKLEKEETKIYLTHLNKAVAPQKQFEVTVKGGSWEFSPKREAQHADDPTPGTFRLKPIRDEDYFLIDLELIDPEEGDEVEHTAEQDDAATIFLEHFGVKGMKWGVRKTRDAHFRTHRNSTANIQKLVGEATALTKHQDLPAINAKHKALGARTSKGVGIVGVSKVPAQKAYRQEVRDAYRKRLEEVANNTTNASGTRKYEIRDKIGANNSSFRWKVKTVKVQHADEDVEEFLVEPIFDKDGYIIDIVHVEDDLEQSDPVLEFFEHHGVKGMKWGVRNDRKGRDRWDPKDHSLEGDLAKGALLPGPPGLPAQVRLVKRAARTDTGQKFLSKSKKGLKAFGRGLNAMGAALAESGWQSGLAKDANHAAVHNHVSKSIDNRVERLQKSPKYRNKNLKTDSDLRKEYYQDVAKVTDSAYRRAVKDTYGENPAGDKTAHYVNDARGPRIEVRDKKQGFPLQEHPLSSMRDIEKRRAEAAAIGHAATDDIPELSIELVLDDNGQISGVGFIQAPDEAMEQAVARGADFLEHYGVRGMRWGVRKERDAPTPVPTASRTVVPHGERRKTQIKVEGGANHDAHPDAVKVAESKAKLRKSGTAALSNAELREVANRLQLESQVKQLTTSKGQKFVKNLLGQQSQNEINSRINVNRQQRLRPQS